MTEKLKEWMPTLPEQEQLVMGWVLTRAAAADDTDVKEYTESSEGGVPVSTLMAEAGGPAGHGGLRKLDTGYRSGEDLEVQMVRSA